jgi:two-component system repressor protein LuxO
MPFELQSKLLRFVQTGVFTPVGGNRPVQTDIRFISATNRDPIRSISAGTLREDLYYRLSIIPIGLPSLRERGDDILLLARHFLKTAAKQELKNFRGFDEDAEHSLRAHPWPGNVRELENVVRYAVIMNTGETVTAPMLNIREKPHGGAPALSQTPQDIKTLLEVERLAIESALKICGGNISEAARRLGINPATIHRKQKQWGKAYS